MTPYFTPYTLHNPSTHFIILHVSCLIPDVFPLISLHFITKACLLIIQVLYRPPPKKPCNLNGCRAFGIILAGYVGLRMSEALTATFRTSPGFTQKSDRGGVSRPYLVLRIIALYQTARCILTLNTPRI